MATRRDNLFKKLRSASGFDPNYSVQNREWFIGAVLDAELDANATTKSDAQIEGDVRSLIAAVNGFVKAERDFTVGVSLDANGKKLERKDVSRRVEAIYGVVGLNHNLAAPSSAPLRQFLQRRRYRGVVRMVHQVNPNDTRGFMHYPYDCKINGNTNQSWRVNIDAQNFWKKTGAGDVPLTVVDKIDTNNDGQPDKDVDPDDAAAKIWSRPFLKNDVCKGNLLDCSTAACCILMDTLFEAADAKKFLKSIKDRAPNHLLIVNPNKEPETHYLWEQEAEPQSVFSKEMVPEENFVVGDHVAVQNHGLYPALVPGGVWGAEHSLVTDLGNRNPNDGKGLRFGGHGLDDPFTIASAYDHLIKTLQTQLHRTYKIADLFLRLMRADPADPTEIPSGQAIKTANLEVKDPRTQTKLKFDGYVIFFDVTYDNYDAAPKAGKRPTITEGEGANPLVIFDIRQTSEIAIARPTLGNKLLDQIARMNTAKDPIMVFMQRVPGTPPQGENYYARSAWKVPFVDADTETQAFHPLFGGPGGSFLQLERKQMPKGDGRYFRAGHPEHGAFATRPTATLTSQYLGFLRSVGAIV